jgi:excisionase family DNA binding protein
MTDREESDRPLSPQQAAELLGVTDRTILRYIGDGHLRATRLPGGRLWRINRADVEALLPKAAS